MREEEKRREEQSRATEGAEKRSWSLVVSVQ
jgi:hypothetical protein